MCIRDRYNPRLMSYLAHKLEGLPCEKIPHVELKQRSAQVKFAIRTGEITPYPNVILQAGCSFFSEKMCIRDSPWTARRY